MEAVNPQEQVTEKPAMEPAWAAFATGAESRWVKKVLQRPGGNDGNTVMTVIVDSATLSVNCLSEIDIQIARESRDRFDSASPVRS